VIEASNTVTITSSWSRDKCGDEALFKLKEKAFEKGANAIISVSTDTSEEEFIESANNPSETPEVKSLRYTIRYIGTAVKTNQL